MKTYWPVRPANRSMPCLHVLGREGHEVHDGVELRVADDLPRRGGVADVGRQETRGVRKRPDRRATAIEHMEVDPEIERALRAGRADHARAADEKDLQGGHRRPAYAGGAASSGATSTSDRE